MSCGSLGSTNLLKRVALMRLSDASTRRALRSAIALFFSILFAMCAGNLCIAQQKEEEKKPSIKPDFAKATLKVGAKEFAAIRVREPWPTEETVGKRLVRIKKAKI